MMNTLLFVLCLVTSSIGHRVDDMHSTIKEDLELERQLNLINKSPIKSIHTKSGYIVDCVDINKQPAFDHPLLKNHKLQTKPSFERNSTAKPIYTLEKVRCPKGTVPVQRTTKDDFVRAKSLFNDHNLTHNSVYRYYAEVFLETSSGPYYGVSGTTSVYNPEVFLGQDSSSHLYVENGANKIVVGWHVSPQIYNDDATHIYSFWRSDKSKTGCFNTRCSGFVQTSRAFYPGIRVSRTSTYGGTMFDLKISLLQDPKSQNWWLNLVDHPIGYFPARLFSNMANAVQVGWGGSTVTFGNAASPPMGSGHFPDGNYEHACYFKYVSYQSASRKDIGPQVYQTRTLNNAPKCYKVEYNGNQEDHVGYVLQFGGPGGDCDD